MCFELCRRSRGAATPAPPCAAALRCTSDTEPLLLHFALSRMGRARRRRGLAVAQARCGRGGSGRLASQVGAEVGGGGAGGRGGRGRGVCAGRGRGAVARQAGRRVHLAHWGGALGGGPEVAGAPHPAACWIDRAKHNGTSDSRKVPHFTTNDAHRRLTSRF